MRYLKCLFILSLLITNCNRKVVAPSSISEVPVPVSKAFIIPDSSNSDSLRLKKEELLKKIQQLEKNRACLMKHKQSENTQIYRYEVQEKKIDNELVKLKKGPVSESNVESGKKTEVDRPAHLPENSFKFDNADVVGYLDNPTPIYIMDSKENSTSDESKKSESEEKVEDELKKLETGSESAVESGGRTVNVANVKAASHDDNEEFPAYLKFCKNTNLSIAEKWKVNERYIIRIIDKDSNPVSNVEVQVKDDSGFVWKALTPSSGEIVLFPLMDLGSHYKSIRDFLISVANVTQKIEPGSDSYITVRIDSAKKIEQNHPVQICFLLDATGSMQDEIQMLKDVIYSIYSRLKSHPSHPSMRFSVVAYRDRGDAYLVKGFPFTNSIDSFQVELESINASGGGDAPEDINAGLQFALDSLSWDKNAAKFIFLVGDAPPHLDYGDKKDYLWASRLARENAIMITPIGASGLDLTGEFTFRQMALLTGGEFVFLNYGERGESSGLATAADPGKVSHHTGSNYNARRLDDIVIDIITRELGYLVGNSKLVQSMSDPLEESDHLDARLSGLLEQIFRPDLNLKGKAVAVAPFSVDDPKLKTTADYLWESSIERTMNIAPVQIIERNRLIEILKENALELSGLTVDNPDPKIGKMLNADFFLFGKIQFIGAVRVCHLRLVDCTTGSIVSASRVKL